METVQLQCGNCQKLMAISAEHLGGQVQCPHCGTVVQTPPRAPQPVSAAMGMGPTMELTKERDSIFAGPEVSEDVIGGARQAPLPREAKSAPVDQTLAEEMPVATQAPPHADADLTTFQRRPLPKPSVLPLIALIFLIPYAISTTLFIVYLLWTSWNRPHPLDLLPDPAPGKQPGKQRQVYRVIPHHPLAAHQMVPLGKPIHVGKDGDLLVTPQRIVLTPEGDLQLVLLAKNISAGTSFEPIDEKFVRYAPSRENEAVSDDRPYTFLESPAKKVKPLFGGTLEFLKKVQGKDQPTTKYLLAPQEEETIVLTTMETKDYREAVANIVKSTDGYLWRVQLRRGFFKYRGKEVSTTAVIGVEFTAQQIDRPKA